MDLEGVILSEICQTEKDKHCIVLLISGTFKKKKKKVKLIETE